MLAFQYSQRFYSLARKLYPQNGFDNSSFMGHPKEALEDLVWYLVAENRMKKETANEFAERYVFGDGSLNDYLADETNEEKVKELLRRLELITE